MGIGHGLLGTTVYTVEIARYCEIYHKFIIQTATSEINMSPYIFSKELRASFSIFEAVIRAGGKSIPLPPRRFP